MTPEQMRELADALEPMAAAPVFDRLDIPGAVALLRQCAEQRPVAYKHTESDGGMTYFVADEAPCEKCVPLYAAPVPPQREPAHDIPLFDFDAEAWKQVLAAARDSKWMPAEYAMNDWLADICQWLRDGPPAGEQREPLSDAQLASVCLSYRHDFGLLDKDEQARLMLEARDWERAFRKEWQR